jgi:hypothetical protein
VSGTPNLITHSSPFSQKKTHQPFFGNRESACFSLAQSAKFGENMRPIRSSQEELQASGLKEETKNFCVFFFCPPILGL